MKKIIKIDVKNSISDIFFAYGEIGNDIAFRVDKLDKDSNKKKNIFIDEKKVKNKKNKLLLEIIN